MVYLAHILILSSKLEAKLQHKSHFGISAFDSLSPTPPFLLPQVISSWLNFVFSFSFLLDLGNTSGLLGFWNGDKEQEFLLPNGSFLDTNSSQSKIHYEFAQLCKQVVLCTILKIISLKIVKGTKYVYVACKNSRG